MTARISEAERIVMEALWRRSPLSADDVIEAVAQPNEWEPATVRTLLNRLLKKGVVTAERADRRYLYAPVLERDAYLTQESGSFLGRLFGGELAPFVSHLSKQQKLSTADIAELKRLIEEIETDDG